MVVLLGSKYSSSDICPRLITRRFDINEHTVGGAFAIDH